MRHASRKWYQYNAVVGAACPHCELPLLRFGKVDIFIFFMGIATPVIQILNIFKHLSAIFWGGYCLVAVLVMFYPWKFIYREAPAAGNISGKNIFRRGRSLAVSFDAVGIAVVENGVVVAGMSWADLQCVSIITTDQGPLADDVLWELREQDGLRLMFPSDADGEPELLREMQARLPAFNNAMVIAAMRSVENHSFLVWSRA